MNIIFIALARSDGEYSSTAFSLAKELSVDHSLFYVENPYTWKDFLVGLGDRKIRTKWKSLLFGIDPIRRIGSSDFHSVTPLLVLPINWMPRGRVYGMFNALNNYLLFRCIKKVVAQIPGDDYLFFNSFNPFYGLAFPSFFRPKLVIYQSVDNMAKSSYISKHGPFLELEYIKKADLTITTSRGLKNKMESIAQLVKLVPNAADFSLFNIASTDVLRRPSEINGQKKRVIIYTGNICHRLDYKLLLNIATSHDDKILLMVGPVNTTNYSLSSLKQKSNVVFAGAKNLNELPAYLQYADCAIIPFLCNELTSDIYPLKINEYLATGIAVVSTNFSEDIAEFGDVISIAKNYAEFSNSINFEIESDSVEKRDLRIAKSASNTWKSRKVYLEELVSELL